MSGSGISWAICKSAPRSRQITMPVPHHSVFLQDGCPSCRPTNSVKALPLTQIHDALLVTRISVTQLIGCSSRTAVCELYFSSVQLHWKACVRICSAGTAALQPIKFVTSTRVANKALCNWVNLVQVSSVQFGAVNTALVAACLQSRCFQTLVLNLVSKYLRLYDVTEINGRSMISMLWGSIDISLLQKQYMLFSSYSS